MTRFFWGLGGLSVEVVVTRNQGTWGGAGFHRSVVPGLFLFNSYECGGNQLIAGDTWKP